MAPADFLSRVRAFYTNHLESHEPVLSTRTSALLSATFTLCYVLPFYLSSKTRPSPTLNRDAPSVIRARLQTVSLTVTAATLTTFYIVAYYAEFPISTALHYIGLYPLDPFSVLKSLLLTAILFLGPLFESIVVDKCFSPISSVSAEISSVLSSSQGYRNYIAGPVTEELLFRSCFVPLHLLAHVSTTRITFLTPLYFGIAHIHHFYEFKLTHPHTSLLPALLRSIFQFAFTSVFGWYATFIYLRTGNLYACIVVHAFCNWMGLPRVWGAVRPEGSGAYSPVVVRGKEDTPGRFDDDDDYDSNKASNTYTMIYYTLLVAGAFGFYQALFPLTSSASALATFTSARD